LNRPKYLGLHLTRRANGSAKSVELAGFPHHALDTYLPKLVRAGKRVAICDQLEDPKLTKKLVKRGVTELVTPGVSYSDTTLNHKENNFLASVYMNKQRVGVSFLDISTGEFLVAEGTAEYVDKLLNSFSPKEVLSIEVNVMILRHYSALNFLLMPLKTGLTPPIQPTNDCSNILKQRL